jgi:hypothetical protein
MDINHMISVSSHATAISSKAQYFPAGLVHCRAALLAVRGSVSRGRTILILGPCNAGKTALWLQVQVRASACLLCVQMGQCATLLQISSTHQFMRGGSMTSCK